MPATHSPSKCGIEGCSYEGKLKRGMCEKHYMRWRRTGDALIVRPPGAVTDKRSKHRMYGAWSAMKSRCHNPNDYSFHKYGAVGITVCDRWRKDFMAFLADMGERPEGMTLDRIDPRGPYSPENCRWATAVEQRANLDPEREAAARTINSEKKRAYWASQRSAMVQENPPNPSENHREER